MLSPFYQEFADKVSFTREQGSNFAKLMADDFNPLHDADAKKFCVPGDLLFSLVLKKYGISKKMHFTFSGMVNENVELILPDVAHDAEKFDITDGEKVYLSVLRSGESSICPALTKSLTKNYVEFSGTTFPHVIIPLMGKQEVMINPTRPMVIYESMSIDLERLDLVSPELEFSEPEFELNGKRGKITLRFNLLENGKLVGTGVKNMLVSGIREYCQTTVDELITFYNQRKTDLKPK
ncbi:DUF3581 family protein [Pseudoalteromonas denitrificans]|uniref:DUF3581 domain-containing protein n=1 Tax=Pseudoalteromonas denitrificans DSM 6059 TaxID=1123010 RepID=A0A1I1E8B3_9GAMM|nr:DUF3581 family protein [Pseudoalteromonas denitrificans]SFB81193.1 Protein of unknown function [Pseudoalteromonas denitrificans DSM 6059]